MNKIIQPANNSLDIWLKLLASNHVKSLRIDHYLLSAELLEVNITRRPLMFNFYMASQALFLFFVLDGSGCSLMHKDEVTFSTVKETCALSCMMTGTYRYLMPVGKHRLLYFIARPEWLQHNTKLTPQLAKFMDKPRHDKKSIYLMPKCKVDGKMLRQLLKLQKLYQSQVADTEAETLKIFNKLMNLYLSMLPTNEYSVPFVSNEEQVAEITAYISQNYRQPDAITLKALADEFYLSERNLTRMFKGEMGITVFEYLLKLRMDLAHSLLQYDNRTAKSVAEAVGYKDQYYFSTAFKKYFGYAPGEAKGKTHKG